MEEIFTNFDYQKPFINKDGFYETIVTYDYKGKKIYFYYLANTKGACLRGAQREIKRRIREKKLKCYSERYLDYVYHNNFKLKLFVGITALVIVGVILAIVLTLFH